MFKMLITFVLNVILSTEFYFLSVDIGPKHQINAGNIHKRYIVVRLQRLNIVANIANNSVMKKIYLFCCCQQWQLSQHCSHPTPVLSSTSAGDWKMFVIVCLLWCCQHCKETCSVSFCFLMLATFLSDEGKKVMLKTVLDSINSVNISKFFKKIVASTCWRKQLAELMSSSLNNVCNIKTDSEWRLVVNEQLDWSILSILQLNVDDAGEMLWTITSFKLLTTKNPPQWRQQCVVGVNAP